MDSIKSYIKYSIYAAILYNIAAYIFIKYGTFTDSWILYIGNFLFGVVIAVFIIIFYRKNSKTTAITNMIFASGITSLIGIFIACLCCLILMLIFIPEAFKADSTMYDKLKAAPAQLYGKNNGFISSLFISAVVGNLGFGLFISLLLPFTIARNQLGNKENENK